MVDVERDITEWRAEANIDFIWLWQVASGVQYTLGTDDLRDIRHHTLKVVRGLMALGVHPGDYRLAESSFRFWPGSEEEQLDRMEMEWIEAGVTPNVGDPICCFALRPTDIAGEPAWLDGHWRDTRGT